MVHSWFKTRVLADRVGFRATFHYKHCLYMFSIILQGFLIWVVSSHSFGLLFIKIRLLWDYLIFIMGITILARPHPYAEKQMVLTFWPKQSGRNLLPLVMQYSRTWPILAQAMACWLTAPSHYQDQYWLHCWGPVPFTRNWCNVNNFRMFEMLHMEITVTSSNAQWVTTLRQRQNWCHFTDNIFKCIFMNEDVRILFKISLKVVPKGPVNNIPALVLIKACCRPGNTPLSEPMMVSLLTLICITRPPWVNILFVLSLKDLTRSNRNSLWNWKILDRNNHDKGQDGEIHLIEWGLNEMAAPGRWQFLQFLTFC